MSLHRGRWQAQGGGIQESEAWSDQVIPSAARGASLLAALEHKLATKERNYRRQAFVRARQFIIVAQRNGGIDAFLTKTFTVAGDLQQRRVDLEVITGRAFYP